VCTNHISGTDEARVIKFCTPADYIKSQHTEDEVSYLEFKFPFQHKYSYIEDKRLKVIYPGNILTSTLAAFLFSSHPKTERDREAHLNYYALAPTTGEDNHRSARLN